MITVVDQGSMDHEHDNDHGSIHPGSSQQSRITHLLKILIRTLDETYLGKTIQQERKHCRAQLIQPIGYT